MQVIRLYICMNTCQTGQFFSLPRQIKPVEEVDLTNVLKQEHQVIQKCKYTSFLHWVIKKRLFQQFSVIKQWS